jgi:hypothetical protein
LEAIMALTAGELSTLLTIVSLARDDFRSTFVPSELDGDTLDRVYVRLLDETKQAVGITND